MRRAIVSIILVFSLIGVTSTVVYAPLSTSSSSPMNHTSMKTIQTSEVLDAGSDVPIDQYLERLFSDQVLTISNSFGTPDTHESTIDLSSYQIPGWTLYKVIIDTDNMTAIAEREVVGSTTTPSASTLFAIYEPGGPSSDVYINQLAQGFYNMGHDGQLQNVSLLYMSPDYDPVFHDYAYIDIRSDYSDGSTNMVSSVQLEDVSFTPTWANVTESAILDANTVYYALINGTKLLDVSDSYPDIRWYFENTAGDFYTARYSTEFGSWGSNAYEAILNYTYIPWNKTSGSALVYSNPSQIDVKLNGSSVVGSSWILSSANNITSFPISTNQSVDIFYNLTLCYTNDKVGSTQWRAAASGSPIEWNVTTDLTYPVVSNINNQTMDITNIPLDWTVTALYLGTTPTGSYSKMGSIVTCSGLSDGTWTLTSTAPNYATTLDLFDSFDASSISYKVANTVTIDVKATVAMDGGTTNFSVLQAGLLVYSPAEIPVSGGSADFQWDISGTTAGNATHSVEVYWLSTDGLEAGYITQEVFVYHSTTLVADDLSIDDFTEDSFNIGVNFDKVSPAMGLDDTPADVTYSFGTTVNASMTDEGGGRWTYVVDTTGMENGVYPLTVYAEGFALENQSLVILVNLDHHTVTLNYSWSNGNSIAYLDSTNLTVTYQMTNGTRIDNAMVNVTFDGQTYDLAWDPISENYRIELHGLNFTGVPDNFTLVVNAWKVGFESQYLDTPWIYIQSVSGEDFSVGYSPGLDISYIETMTISVVYNYSLVPIPNATVYVTFDGGGQRNLTFNTFTQKWEIVVRGEDYLGTQIINVTAMSDGYNTTFETQTFNVYEDTLSLIGDWTLNSTTTDYATNVPLTITLTMSNGTPITDASVSFTAFGTPYSLSSGPGGQYTFSIDPTETRGVETFIVSVVRTGFVSDQITLNLTVEATTTLNFRNLLSEEYEQWNLTVEARYLDSFYSTPIENATVMVTLDGTDYPMQYSAGIYSVEIALDVAPGDYIILISASAEFAVDGMNQADFTVREKEHVYLEVTFDGDLIAGQFMEIRATLRSNATNNPPIQGQPIRFEVSVYFDNGTIIPYSNEGMTDTTNAQGIATLGFEVPFGNIEKLAVLAIYDGSRIRWSAQVTEETGVEVSPLSLLIAFFMSDIGLLMILSIVVLGIVAAGYNRGIKPKKRAARLSLENQLQMFKDLETVQHFMAVYLDRGTCVFYHPFTEERIQPDLISGFIAAITSVYGEIKGDGVRGTLEEIQYHGLRLNSYSGQYIIGILILEGEMTPLLKERLQFFVELFENQYERDLDHWTGLVDCFDPEWVVSTLNAAFNYSWHLPHRFGPTQKVTKTDAKMLDYISAVRDERNEFYIKNLLGPLAEMLEKTEAEVLDRLLLLEERGIIVPIGVQTILQRQGLTLAEGAEEQIIRPPESVDESEEVLEFDELEESQEPTIEEEKEVEAPPEPEPEDDSMEAFVQDVESLLVAKAKDEEKKPEDNELDQFVKELKDKIGDDEESED